MATVVTEGETTRVSLASGETSQAIYIPSAADVVATAIPGGGGSMSVSASWSMVRELQAGAGEWQEWDHGTVTTRALQSLYKATAVRFTATGASGVGEIRR